MLHCCGKIFWQKEVKKQHVILAGSSRPSPCRGSQASGSLSSHHISSIRAQRDEPHLLISSFSLFYAVQDPLPTEQGPWQLRWMFANQVNTINVVPQRQEANHLGGACRVYQFGSCLVTIRKSSPLQQVSGVCWCWGLGSKDKKYWCIRSCIEGEDKFTCTFILTFLFNSCMTLRNTFTSPNQSDQQ